MAGLPLFGWQENKVPLSSCMDISLQVFQRRYSGLTQASVVVQKWVGEVEVSMCLTVIELYCDGIVCILIDGPDNSCKI